MLVCPNCQAALVRTEGTYGISWLCPRCGGRAAGLGLLRRTAAGDYATRAWVLARSKTTTGERICPVCTGPMVEVPSLPDYASPTLDVCRRCHLFWFDPREFEQVPAIPLVARHAPSVSLGAVQSSGLPSAAVEILAVERASTVVEHVPGAAGPDTWWQWIPGLLGLPVEVGSRVSRLAWATWLLAGLIMAVSVAAFANLQRAVDLLGLIPAQAGRFFGLTLVSSFFIHGGFVHLAGNLYYLLLFGDNVEDCLGRVRFVFLVAFAALVGSIAHVAFDPRSDVPVIGASGGISGLVAFYGLKFPQARMVFLIWFRWVRVPAYGFLAFWLLLQTLTAWQQIAGVTSVSALAHLGGAAVGAWWWAIWRDESRKRV